MAATSRLFRPSSWPLAVKLSLELVLAALVPLLLAMWITTSQSRARLQGQAADNVELLAGVTAARLDQLLLDTSRVAHTLSKEDLIVRYCAGDDATRRELLPAVQRKIELIVHSNPDFASVLIDDAGGKCLAATSADMVGVDYSFREYFQKARHGEYFISPMIVGKTSKVPGIFFSAPVHAEATAPATMPSATAPAGDIVGVVALKLDGRGVWSLIDSVRVGERGHAMLSNADGVCVAHPDHDKLFHSFAPLSQDRISAIDPKTQWNVQTIGSLDLPELMNALPKAKSHGTQRFTAASDLDPDSDREQWIAGFAPMKQRDMVVSIVQPMCEFDQPIAAMLRQQIWIVLAVAMFAAALALLQARRTVRPVLAVTKAANQLAHGDFNTRAPKMSDDEIGQMAQAFNDMVPQLKERVDLQQSLKVAMEVQQSLLPASDPHPPGLDVAGRSKYCDATGGDYFDFLDISRVSDTTTLIALGDVMGHGVASALLMATARAALRTSALNEGSLSTLMNRVNRVLAADARHGRFMTMALVIIDPRAGTVRWASAGHDPVIVYHPRTDAFEELEGGDLPLGVVEDLEYQEFHRAGLQPGDVLLIGTDGIWELRAPSTNGESGEMYGKDRLRQFIKAQHHRPSADIASALEAELAQFNGGIGAQDDVTFVLVRVVAIP